MNRLLNQNEITLRLQSYGSFLLNSSDNNSVLFDPQMRDPVDKLKIHARPNEYTGDGIKVLGYVEKANCDLVPAQSCEFNVYEVDQQTWAKTLRHTESVSPQVDYSFQLDLTEAQLSTETIGEKTFFITASANRFGDVLCEQDYFNNLGVFGYLVRVKNKVTFIEVTK